MAEGAAASLCHARWLLSGIQGLFSFPVETRGRKREGRKGIDGKDRRGTAGMAEGAAGMKGGGISLSCPTVVIGHPESFLFSR